MESESTINFRLRDFVPIKGALDYVSRNDDKAPLIYNLKELALMGYNSAILGSLAYGFWAGLDKILSS